MAKLIRTLNAGDGAFPVPFLKDFDVKAGTASSILPGYLVISDGSNAGYVKAAANGTASTSVRVGVAISTSSETASADGTILVETAPYLLVQMFAETPGNLAQALKLTKCTLDVSSGNYLLDENDTTNGFIRLYEWDNTTNGLCICSFQCDIWG